MKTYDFTALTIKEFTNEIFKFNQENACSVSEIVSDIIKDVKTNGIDACLRLTKKFDGVNFSNTELITTYNEIKDCDIEDSLFKESFYKAKENIYNFHKNQKPNNFKIEQDDYIAKETWVPLDSVGCYVPGGSAPLISTILMTVIPAKLAGVKNIIVCTPPSKQNAINPYIKWACKELKVDKIVNLGGAQAISALALGIDQLDKVNKVVGPGNKFVTEAKKQLFGIVDIDMLAGPSEICIIADETTSSEFIAADLLSQLEHDKDAVGTIVTTSATLIDEVKISLKKQVKMLTRKDIIDFSSNNISFVIVKDTDQIKTVVDIIAPEHLEIMSDNFEQLENYPFKAGVVFAGPYTPVSVGDFYGGTNHVLPTNQRAAFSSPLSVYDFFRRINFLKYSEKKLQKERKYIEKFAETEMLDAHKNAISIRFNKTNN